MTRSGLLSEEFALAISHTITNYVYENCRHLDGKTITGKILEGQKTRLVRDTGFLKGNGEQILGIAEADWPMLWEELVKNTKCEFLTYVRGYGENTVYRLRFPEPSVQEEREEKTPVRDTMILNVEGVRYTYIRADLAIPVCPGICVDLNEEDQTVHISVPQGWRVSVQTSN